jgi:hypothetical protein
VFSSILALAVNKTAETPRVYIPLCSEVALALLVNRSFGRLTRVCLLEKFSSSFAIRVIRRPYFLAYVGSAYSLILWSRLAYARRPTTRCSVRHKSPDPAYLLASSFKTTHGRPFPSSGLVMW